MKAIVFQCDPTRPPPLPLVLAQFLQEAQVEERDLICLVPTHVRLIDGAVTGWLALAHDSKPAAENGQAKGPEIVQP